MMDLAMMGCGTGAIIEPHLINRLPVVRQALVIDQVTDIGRTPAELRQEHTSHTIDGQHVAIKVGDTRRGWVDSYQLLLELCSDPRFEGPVHISVDLSDVRPVGESLKGFGGMANPVKLRDLYGRVAQILGKAVGRQLTSVECCLLIDEAAVTIVAGNIPPQCGHASVLGRGSGRLHRQGQPLAAGQRGQLAHRSGARFAADGEPHPRLPHPAQPCGGAGVCHQTVSER
jgi:ribonucleotide reductase class II